MRPLTAVPAVPSFADRARRHDHPGAAHDLLDLAADLLDGREGWASRVIHDPRRRFYARIAADSTCDAWVVGWAPGQGVAAHEHGASTGALAVAEGRLLEVRFDDPDAPTTWLHHEGSAATVARGIVHSLSNVDDAPATSVHVYSPPLRSMRFLAPAARHPAGGSVRTEGVAVWGDTSHPSTVDALLADARARLHRLGPGEAYRAWQSGALLVDTRPERDRRAEGVIPGAVVIERNVLEWRLDPASPHRVPEMDRHDRPVVLFCNDGYASSLAAAALHDLGIVEATDMTGGYRAWRLAGLPVLSVAYGVSP